MRAARLALVAGCLLAVAAAVGGCGGDSGSDGSSSTAAVEAESRPAPPKGTFPQPRGRSLEALLEEADSAAELVVSPTAKVFYRGGNRYPFGVFERDEAELTDAEVALYLARVPTPPEPKGGKSKSGGRGEVAKAQERALKEPAIGPFPAAIESLAGGPAFRGDTPGVEPSPVVYAARLEFPSDGEWRIAALIKEGSGFGAKLLPGVVVGEFHRVPRRGRPAPRMPAPGTRNEENYAEELGKRPIVLLFATPKFCQSRVCGPVVDVAEQVEREYGDEAAFIHMEIYKENDPGKGARPEVRAFHLPSQPWLFTIGREGVVESAIEGPVGPELMTEAVERLVAE